MPFTTRDDFLRRAAARLAPVSADLGEPTRTDNDLNPGSPMYFAKPPWRRAAVFVGLVERDEDFGVLLTLRPQTMAEHAGQVAFPGGRIDPSDAGPLAAALREAHEEVGVDPESVNLLGQSDPYLTSTGYVVSPFVGVLPPDFVPVREKYEVAEVFETPLSFLMHPRNHERHEREFRGSLRAYYAMPHDGHYIWGATAGMIKALYDRLYNEGEGV